MSRILLADDSPHAQRMGERILREEGFEVVTVTDGHTALMRLADVDPDLIFADVSLPRKSGYEICREVKNRPRHRHVRVVLTAGLLESFDEAEAQAVCSDAVVKKPFEASAVLATIKPLLEAAQRERAERDPALEPMPAMPHAHLSPDRAGEEQSLEPLAQIEPDAERVRAAVTLALDAALPSMIDKITEQVLVALGH